MSTSEETEMRRTGVYVLALLAAVFSQPGTAQKPAHVMPHGQDQVPGPPLSPAEAIKRMKVPDGFSVELVASEPDIVNPVAMTFDERGRIWITESLEYPRRSAGPGRDRIKVLESTKGDGRYDKITVFAEGLNIPSGIAVGHGGVWVANSPDILFLRDTDGDGQADRRQVVVTGFGRDDTHELPNSLTWGPDGWLYGLNGVFNPSHVKSGGKEFHFTCALFRIHPKTREFQLFCEGTSNPWGVGWDAEGSAFVSACVIDHLWHLVETGYYHRQGGPYPAYTWKLGSIVRHKHQKAAYCGLHFFDSDAYPPEYRGRLYMGNIHGNCINVDVLSRDGSTYFARPAPDFLTANDPWFMPVAQKTGPDGCLYVLDWYDRYHCYQDANRDPRGIDRLRGRLYRVRYKDSPRAGTFDLSKESDEQLIRQLHSPNVYFRDIAQRLLCERNHPETRPLLEKLVLDGEAPRKARMHALWALVGTGTLDADFHQKLLRHQDPPYRAWGVRAAGNFHKVDHVIRERIVSLAHDPNSDVQLQVAIAARKLDGVEPIPLLLEVLSSCGNDKLIPHIVWQNLHPLLDDKSELLLRIVAKTDLNAAPNVVHLMPRVIDRILGGRKPDPAAVCDLILRMNESDKAYSGCCQCLATLSGKVQAGELTGGALTVVKERLQPLFRKVLVPGADEDAPLHHETTMLAATLKDPAGIRRAHPYFAESRWPEPIRLQALSALLAAGDGSVLDEIATLLAEPQASPPAFRGQVLAALGKLDNPRVADVVLFHYAKMEPEVQPRAVELLTQRTPWSKALLQAIARKTIPPEALNVNQIRRLLASKDAELVKHVKSLWGTVRTERDPERERLVADMRNFLRSRRGDAAAGRQVFKNVCGQCHKIHGEGQDVGPDITVNGRSDFEQLVSNVFDPNLVIGAAYQATTVITTKGQIVTGLLVEDGPQRVVLKQQGGKLETIPRADIDEMTTSKVSLMPEGLEKQLKPQEIADLFAFLALDKPPGDPAARKIKGAPK
jgi:putative membrane-bound dehydrogenase-like protein